MRIEVIIDQDEKARICENILMDLPDWFGLPESTQAYIDEVRDLTFIAIFHRDQAVGFVSRQQTSTDTCEIHCMGVLKNFHRQGLGKILFDEIKRSSIEDGYRYIQVKTVDEGHYAEYDQTIAFYKNMGFAKLEVFPTLWDEWNPCLVMVQKLS